MEEFKLGPFLGENNRLPEFRLATEDGAFVRAAVNVDLTRAGTFRRRKGSSLSLGGSDCHSLWADGVNCYFVDGDTLYRVGGTHANLHKSPVITGLPPGQRMSYAAANTEVYCTNGASLWRLRGALAAPACLPLPPAQPRVTVGVGGLVAGAYQVAVSFLAHDGEESAATHPVIVEVPASSSLELTGIPQLAGCVTNIYVADANSTILHLVGSTSDTEFSVAVWGALEGGICRTLGLQPMPPGQIVAYLNGCLYVACGNILFQSEPYLLGMYNPVSGYTLFAEPITMLAPCQNGLYVAADQTYWISGPPGQVELSPVLPYGAIFGTSQPVPNKNAVWWMSERGAVQGVQTGEVRNLQEEHVATVPAVAGASMLREQDGLKQMVASLFGPQQTVMAASSYMDAEVVRKGTIL